jgi:hypothetical protein
MGDRGPRNLSPPPFGPRWIIPQAPQMCDEAVMQASAWSYHLGEVGIGYPPVDERHLPFGWKGII